MTRINCRPRDKWLHTTIVTWPVDGKPVDIGLYYVIIEDNNQVDQKTCWPHTFSVWAEPATDTAMISERFTSPAKGIIASFKKSNPPRQPQRQPS